MMKINNISMRKFFKKLKKEIIKTVKENPNYAIKVRMDMYIEGETAVDIQIYVDETKLILDE